MRKLSLFIILLFVAAACGKGGSETPAPSIILGKATLNSPAQDEACTTGTSLSSTESTVTFYWFAGNNAESYELVVKNLLNNVITKKTVTTNFTDVPLAKDTPFSWYVISKSSKTSSTAQSDTWKFYNAGSGRTNYAPFPAEIIAPTYNQSINSGNITLQWKGADADNDITGYDVYFGTSETDVNNKLSSLSKSFAANVLSTTVQTSAATTYYWKVITKDSKDNTSDSGVFKFRTN